MRRVVLAVVMVPRLLAAAGLVVAAPQADLAAWDIGRFAQVYEGGRPWVDQAVEYPPLMVALLWALFTLASELVVAHRLLVLASLAVDLATAGVIRRAAGDTAALWYLALGLPLVPEGYLRFDLWAGLAAAVGLIALARRQPAVFALAVTAGAAIKIWPATLLVSALGLGRWRSLVAAGTVGLISLAAWIGFAGVDAPLQVLSLRDATGWHAETPAGSLVALFEGDDTLRRENDAYRLGTLDPTIVTALRAIAVGTMAGLALLARRNRVADSLATAAALAAGATAALMVTAPLLSTQFLLWLTVPAALTAARPERGPVPNQPWLPALRLAALVACVITGLTLKLVGPTGVTAPPAAVALLVRDVALVAVVAAAAAALAQLGRRAA